MNIQMQYYYCIWPKCVLKQQKNRQKLIFKKHEHWKTNEIATQKIKYIGKRCFSCSLSVVAHRHTAHTYLRLLLNFWCFQCHWRARVAGRRARRAYPPDEDRCRWRDPIDSKRNTLDKQKTKTPYMKIMPDIHAHTHIH